MKKQLFRLSGTIMVALLVAGCASDPLDDFRNKVTSVSTSLSYTELLVGASIEGRAQARDAQGNALAVIPEISSANTAVASVTDDPRSGEPEPTAIFSIVATGFGITTVTASSGSSSADITVQTFPASVAVTGIAAGTQIGSGLTVQLTATPVGTDGSPVAGGPSITWASGDLSIATVDAAGLVSAFSPGLAVITATTNGGAVGQASFEVVAGPFDGTITAAVAFPAQITITPGTVAWTGNEVVTVDGFSPTWFDQADASAIVFRPNDWGVGTHTVVIANAGTSFLAFQTTFDLTAESAPNAAPPGPDITASLPLTIWTALDGQQLDDFYAIAPAADMPITVTYEWGDPADFLDILIVDCAFTFSFVNQDGATTANPELTSFTVPAGLCYTVWFAYFQGPEQVAKGVITSP